MPERKLLELEFKLRNESVKLEISYGLHTFKKHSIKFCFDHPR